MKIRCDVCTRRCNLSEGQLGFCHARQAKDGKIISTNYGQVTSISLDSIEKKPLNNYMPGSKVLSVGSFGCNFTCEFCQNYIIATSDGSNINKRYISPKELVKMAEELVAEGNIGVAYTYNEPLIGYEYVLDCSKLIHKHSLKNILVTNGSINNEIFKEVIGHIDAVNIDLKAFSEDFYKRVGGDLQTTLENIKIAAKTTHIELTNLVIPGLNDNEEEMRKMVKWIADINPEIPLHISRFFPAYKMWDSSPTPLETIYKFVGIAKEYLKNVYPGNC
ncbi:AmmeMemoRadiSam system radical SAM enzyme [Miniphocaeibacter halophilus]|uniref:AmmeMemoRadiSam system radical SAM enzyme n=1 Tax=Miniphocaeibacter halophilus TaxID=2931922 RepID=A0AC61MT56_9FIRM|nr:AmmeMemoRadiSam system radical SAM enzyme [Miniphocaeibacter halophilus]QQK08875.1 AmmeMemoRadiSam system radical SAM enzyme [Miniphocaeibacter halophilus]